jgi:hypothetical protein
MKISTFTSKLVLPILDTLPTSSIIVPAGIGCLKSILSDETVTHIFRVNLVAVKSHFVH